MAFVARCSFCHLILREVPEARLGGSVDCPRCGNSFTLAPATDPVAAAHAARVEAPAPPEATEAVAEKRAAPLTALVEVPEAGPLPAVAPIEGATSLGERPSSEIPAEAPASPVPGPRFTNYPGLASFLLGCFAFLAGSVLHAGLATLALGLLGLLLGTLGLLLSWLIPCRRVLPVAGLAVSLPALLLPVLAPAWVGLNPLGAPPRPANRGDAAMSLSGAGGLRRSTEAETFWVDAGRDALHHADVRLRVSSAVVGPVEFEPVAGRRPPPDRCLVVGLRLTNAGVMRNVAYTGWADGEPPVLRDNQGKGYAPKAFGAGWVVKGRIPSATIPPGKSHNDVLVFEAPPGGVAYLRLELPAAAVGADGWLRVEIPKQMILFR